MSTMSQTPTVGRIVHYQSYGTPGGEYLPEPRAAIVTATHTAPTPPGEAEALPYAVDLAILNPTGMFFNQDVPFSEGPNPGHWNWPPRAS
jgi:hypothetical protein